MLRPGGDRGEGGGEGGGTTNAVPSATTPTAQEEAMIDVPSYFRLDDQVAVVTGGASGIGESTAQVLASAGAAVVVGDIDEEGAARTAKQITAGGGRATAVRCDTSRRADVDALVERAVAEFGQLDVMANVAGVGYGRP